MSKARTFISNVICRCYFLAFDGLTWEVIVCFVDIGGIVDHNLFYLLFIKFCLEMGMDLSMYCIILDIYCILHFLHFRQRHTIYIDSIMHYDDAFRHIGEFGRYQKFLYLLICLPQMFSGIQTFLPVFILHVPDHRWVMLIIYYNDVSFLSPLRY